MQSLISDRSFFFSKSSQFSKSSFNLKKEKLLFDIIFFFYFEKVLYLFSSFKLFFWKIESYVLNKPRYFTQQLIKYYTIGGRPFKTSMIFGYILTIFSLMLIKAYFLLHSKLYHKTKRSFFFVSPISQLHYVIIIFAALLVILCYQYISEKILSSFLLIQILSK